MRRIFLTTIIYIRYGNLSERKQLFQEECFYFSTLLWSSILQFTFDTPCWLAACFLQTLTWLLGGIVHQTHGSLGPPRATCRCSPVHCVHRQPDGASPKLRRARSPPWLHRGQGPFPCWCGRPSQDLCHGQQSVGDQGMLGFLPTTLLWKYCSGSHSLHILNAGDLPLPHFEDDRISFAPFFFFRLHNYFCSILHMM